ncbi:putative aldouronate transport system substrate-binding protein [Anaerotaenia torta]|uniref:DUF3502 domain-containing protein n=1 Tax=Anaerotaenia torta TaxID=433293 RepID=UPI003D1FAA01
MKRINRKRFISVLIVLCLSLSLLSGCGRSNNDPGKTEETGSDNKTTPTTAADTTETSTPKPEDAGEEAADDMPDTSTPLVLKGYTIAGSVPALWEEVQAAVNEILSKEINTTIEMTIVPMGDAKTKLPMVNASGEEYDFMFVAHWLSNYGPEVAKGAYEEITTDMLAKYMPRYYAAVDKVNLTAMSINDKLYCLPQTYNAVNPTGVEIRKDLREKYGIGPIETTADLEKYMAAVAENEEGMIPFNVSKAEVTTGLFDLYFTEYFGDYMFSLPGLTTVQTPYEDETGTVYSLLDQKFYDAYKKTAEKMKELYDKGYVPKNPFGNEVRSNTALIEGQSGVAKNNLTGFAIDYVKAQGNGFELEFYPMTSSKGRVLKPVAGQGVAIKAGNKNIERVLMAMDYIFEHPQIVEMLEYGVEGKSYVVTPDGKIDLPEGVNASNSPYSQGAVAFWFSDDAFKRPMASWPQQKMDIQTEYATKAVQPVLNALSLDAEAFKTEASATKGVDDLEGNSLKIGMTDDVDAMMDTYLKKLKSAGYEKLVEEVTKQAEAYKSSLK